MGTRVFRALEEADAFDRQRDRGFEANAELDGVRVGGVSTAGANPEKMLPPAMLETERSGSAPSAASAEPVAGDSAHTDTTRNAVNTIDLKVRLHNYLPRYHRHSRSKWMNRPSWPAGTNCLTQRGAPAGNLRAGCEPVAVAPPPRVSNLSPAPPATAATPEKSSAGRDANVTLHEPVSSSASDYSPTPALRISIRIANSADQTTKRTSAQKPCTCRRVSVVMDRGGGRRTARCVQVASWSRPAPMALSERSGTPVWGCRRSPVNSPVANSGYCQSAGRPESSPSTRPPTTYNTRGRGHRRARCQFHG